MILLSDRYCGLSLKWLFRSSLSSDSRVNKMAPALRDHAIRVTPSHETSLEVFTCPHITFSTTAPPQHGQTLSARHMTSIYLQQQRSPTSLGHSDMHRLPMTCRTPTNKSFHIKLPRINSYISCTLVLIISNNNQEAVANLKISTNASLCIHS